MKKLTLVLAVLMVLLAFVGCGPTGTEEGNDNTVDFAFDTESFQGKELTLWANWEESDSAGDVALFEEKTGADIKWEMIPYGTSSDGSDYYGKISTAIVSGTGPDATFLWQFAVPTWTQKGLVLPWTDVIDLTAEPFAGKLNQAVVDYYTYNGQPYGIINTSEMNIYWIYYDKQIFSDSGLEDPYTLFREGKWTWEKFQELAEQLTYDSDQDGNVDKYGWGGYDADGWIASNGTNYVDFDENGAPRFALADAPGIAALEKTREVFGTVKAYSEIGEPDENNFISGKVAMYYEGTWSVKLLKEAKGDNLGVVPMPMGPNFDPAKVTAVEANAVPMFICNTCDEKELLAHYVTYLYTDKGSEEKRRKENIEENWGGDEEMYNFFQELKQYSWIPNDISFGRLNKLLSLKVMWNYEETPTSTVQAIFNQAQGEIDDVFNGTAE
ncbi:MAG: extracellular solute-binding protein [Oscillospiraceae bacterium]|nr:extracellular solute-binding protein [Oscillospiraceae bacterium]